VIVPGIGQSKVDLVDEKGNRIKSAWPLDLKGEDLMGGLKGPLLKTMTFRRDMGLSDKLAEIVRKAAQPIAGTDEGDPVSRLRVVSYPYSVAECNEEEKRYIYKMVPLENLAEIIGEDHLYFYAYHSFGSVYDNAAGLDEFIQTVKTSTGHDKVNLIPVSLGGALATAYLDAYGDKGDVAKVLYFVAALNGSQIAGDVLSRNLLTDDVQPLLREIAGSNAKELSSILKMMPKGVPEKVVESLLDAVLDTVIIKSTMMWAIVPCQLYEGLRDKYLLDKRYDVLRAKTDRYHKAHENLKEMIDNLRQKGVGFYSICGYGKKFPPFVKSCHMSSDGTIDVFSTSLGAYCAPLGETLPEDYVQKNTYCKDSAHNHISPDRTVDASSGFLPETTWYFLDQVHDDVAFNDIALELAKKILTDPEFDSVFADPRFPQFNNARNIRKIKYDLLPKAKAADRSKLFPGQLAVLDGALTRADAMFENTLAVDSSEVAEVETALREAVELITSDAAQ
jgi:pimeloyl-ACP methyl ester carboxylesterase